MKAVVLLASCLALLMVLPAPAFAQQTGSLVVMLAPTDDALRSGEGPLTISGTAMLTVDITAMTGIIGIPVTYTVTKQPEWASVVISPSSDVFPTPYPPVGLSYTVTRPIVVTVTLADAPAADTSGVIEITAVTTAAMGGRSFVGAGATPIVFDAPEEPCPEHALTTAQAIALATEAANAYKSEQQAASSDDAVTTQSTKASPISLPWVAVGGFAMLGASVGLVLRRKFTK